MKHFYLGVTIVVIGLCFEGTATNSSRKSGIFLNFEYQWDGHLLADWSSPRHRSPTADTLDVSSLFFGILFQSHTKKEWPVRHLNLSNHRKLKMMLSPLARLQALETLNLSNSALHSLSLDLLPPHSLLPRLQRSRSHRGLPRLKVLILQRNQLSGIPKGLWKLKSLQSLDLSCNGIVRIRLSDFRSCLQLKSIYLKSNKISMIHPEAFKGLKKLQVLDLRSNALTTLLPIVTIALEAPHLELDLADNQWLCGDSNANFQNFTSASWREKWNAICNMSVGNEKPYLETPQIRISRDTHLPPTTPSDMESFIQSKAERPQEGMDMRLSALRKEAQVGYDDLREIWPEPFTELRDSQDKQDTDKKSDNSSNLVLAICLSVLITFVVAFCLGAFTRPYLDRLWQQRCLNKRPGSDNAYSNEGFSDDIEAAHRVQHQQADLQQASQHPNLYENHNPSWVTEPIPHTDVISERTLGSSRVDLGSHQSPVQHEDNIRARSTDGNVLPNGYMAYSTLHGLPNAGAHKLISAEQDHCDVLEESHYDPVAQEYSLYEDVMVGSSMAGPLGSVSISINGGCDKLHLSQSSNAVASCSNTLAHTNTQGAGESKERVCPEALEALGSQTEFSEERPVSDSISWLTTQQSNFQEASPEERFSDVDSEVLCNDPREEDPHSLMPRWGSGFHVTPAAEEPVQRDAPFDPHYDLETNYESDSDEGSLFTLSSEGSEDMRSLTEDQASGENGGPSQSLHSRNLGEYQDGETPVENVEDITSQRALEKCRTWEVHFGNSLNSGPDSFA